MNSQRHPRYKKARGHQKRFFSEFLRFSHIDHYSAISSPEVWDNRDRAVHYHISNLGLHLGSDTRLVAGRGDILLDWRQ
jgi:hypothetical protein